jgi:hypothetical protein
LGELGAAERAMTTPQSRREPPGRKPPDRSVDLLTTLVDEHLEVDRDVILLTAETWAIHGYLAYEGDVIAATIATEHEAWAGISLLDEIQRGGSR